MENLKEYDKYLEMAMASDMKIGHIINKLIEKISIIPIIFIKRCFDNSNKKIDNLENNIINFTKENSLVNSFVFDVWGFLKDDTYKDKIYKEDAFGISSDIIYIYDKLKKDEKGLKIIGEAFNQFVEKYDLYQENIEELFYAFVYKMLWYILLNKKPSYRFNEDSLYHEKINIIAKKYSVFVEHEKQNVDSTKEFDMYMEREIDTDSSLAISFVNALKRYKDVSLEMIAKRLKLLFNKLNDNEAKYILNLFPDNINYEESEDNKFIKSMKELVSEMFPTFSFYPAFNMWLILGKAIKNKSFTSLSRTEITELIIYTTIFVGILGSRIAKNRIKEFIIEKKNKKIEEPEFEPEGEDKITSKPLLRRIK